MDIPWGLRKFLPDVALAAATAAFALASAALAPNGRAPFDPLGYVLLLTGPLALTACRRAPVSALLVTTVCALGYLLRGYPGVAAAVPVMVALLIAVRSGHRLSTLIPAAAIVIVVVADLTVVGQDVRQIVENRFLLTGWLVASAVLGETFRQWTAYTRQVEERAAEAERAREEAARHRAGEERLRIARELHDSLTHSISIIKVQAGVAIHLARKRGEEVPQALLAVQEASADAMNELRATLEVLRHRPESGADEPGVGCDRLPSLIDRTRAAGLPTTVTVTGDRRALSADLKRAVYRIIQEALTNVTRHAGPATATVSIDYGSDLLTIRVDDDGPGTLGPPSEPGVGLRGMWERITALGGRLYAGPRPEGGFSVDAQIPLRVPPDDRPGGHDPMAGREAKERA
ncbi:histidine kinase [Streptosporangium sp. LJ11]|uniref:sensor histidine kinase n=1 Tax=Streptosporangium sp. LJ11 TaxID=3436927 RepID=UPI003F78D4BF